MSLRIVAIACLAVIGALICIAGLRANEVMDFWREEYSRQNRSRAAALAPVPRTLSPAPSTTSKARPTGAPKREEDKGSARSGGRLHCVRTCDGYYFPANASGSDREDAKTCAALCPGAPTEPYRLAGGAQIEDAVSSKGKRYAALPAAFSYRAELVKGCSCGRTREPSAALMQDKTLVPGDIVVTAAGIRVFAGGKDIPYRQSDFVPYREARDLPRRVKSYLASIDHPARASESKHASKAARDDVRSPGRDAKKSPDAFSQDECSADASERRKQARSARQRCDDPAETTGTASR
jgi:hypothetical protein